MKSLDELPIREVMIEDIKGIHPIAEENTIMSKEYFDKIFIPSIKNIGYITRAITLFRNKIVDGRHRYKASILLEYKTIPCRIIPHNTKLTEIQEKLIMAEEVRRHITPTQQSCLLAKEYYRLQGTEEKTSQAKLLKIKGNPVSLFLFKKAVYIYKHDRTIFEQLLDGNTIRVKNNYSTRLDVIAEMIKDRLKQDTTQQEDITVSESFLNDEYTINGKKEFQANILKEAEAKFNMSAKDIADMFYAISKVDL